MPQIHISVCIFNGVQPQYSNNVVMSLYVRYIAIHMYHQIVVKSNTVMSVL